MQSSLTLVTESSSKISDFSLARLNGHSKSMMSQRYWWSDRLDLYASCTWKT